ncbi:MAG TPA: hypothetical protein VN665_03485 [Candidatus Paceibacterota bacterium]|nr:hypothetical protein [Candidatus Paceibacterota bacterium]
MTLTTHAIVGAAAASLVPNHPVIGFIGGLASHFAIDSIPHWNEGRFIRSVKKVDNNPLTRRINRSWDLLHDFALVGFDSLLGFAGSVAILFYLFHAPLYIVLLGAFAGQMPDGLQFVYFVFHPKFMDALQRFHGRIQTESTEIAYLGIEAGLILAVIALGILGAF